MHGHLFASTFGNPESVKFGHYKLIEEIMIGRGWQILREHPNQTSLAKALHDLHAHH